MNAKNNKENGFNVILSVRLQKRAARLTADHLLTRRRAGSWTTLFLSTSTTTPIS